MNRRKDIKLVINIRDFPKANQLFLAEMFFSLNNLGIQTYVLTQNFNASLFEEISGANKAKLKSHILITHSLKLRGKQIFSLVKYFIEIGCKDFSVLKHYILWGSRRLGIRILSKVYEDYPLIKLKPDLIYFPFGYRDIYKVYLKNALKVKLVYGFRGPDYNLYSETEKNVYLPIWKFADGIHFLSKALKQAAFNAGYKGHLPSVIIPPAINFSEIINKQVSIQLELLGKGDRVIKLISVGRLSSEKGYDDAIIILDKLAKKGYCFLYYIIGNGQEKEKLLGLIDKFNLNSKVKLLGLLPKDTVVEYLVQSDIFLHCAIYEGFCNAVLEAQAVGLPVVSTNVGGLCENVLDRKTGFLLKPQDYEDFVSKIILLAENPQLRQIMGNQGRERVLKEFSVEAQMNNFADFFKKVYEKQN